MSPIVEAFILSRVLLLAVTGALSVLLHQTPLTLWDRWDSRWYLGIAVHGYHWTVDGKPTIAFFPLYPLLVHLGMGPGLSGEVTGVVLSNVAFAGALFYLHRLTLERWSDMAARRSVWLLALFPTAFFTFAPYTEALFLLSALGAVYHARRGQAIPAAMWTTAAILTRSTGFAVVAAVLIALGIHRGRSWLAAVVLPCSALAGYVAYLNGAGVPVAALVGSERAWHRSLTFPWTGFTSSVQWLTGHAIGNVPWAVENVLQLSVTLLFLGLTVWAWRYLDAAGAAYCATFWALVLLSPEWLDGYYAPFSSMDRFVLVLFPPLGWLAAKLPVERFRVVAVGSAACMVGMAAIHLYGGWIG